MNKILIVDPMHESIVPLLEGNGFKVVYKPTIRRSDIVECIDEYIGLIVRSKTPIDHELINAATNLKFVARAGAGIDQLDVEAIEKRNIEIVNSPEGNRDALGEHALGMLLCLANNITVGDAKVRRKLWDREGSRGFEVKNKTVALIGYGQMGSAFSEKLSGLECGVIAYDKYKSNYSSSIVKECTMNEVFNEADILSLHVPLTEETRDMVNESYFDKFKKEIVVINTSRGEVLNLKHLIKMLDSGKVKCAALDVLENEKLNTLTEEQNQIFETLIEYDRVLLTPHVGGWTFESYERINRVLVDKISKLDCFKL